MVGEDGECSPSKDATEEDEADADDELVPEGRGAGWLALFV